MNWTLFLRQLMIEFRETRRDSTCFDTCVYRAYYSFYVGHILRAFGRCDCNVLVEECKICESIAQIHPDVISIECLTPNEELNTSLEEVCAYTQVMKQFVETRIPANYKVHVEETWPRPDPELFTIEICSTRD